MSGREESGFQYWEHGYPCWVLFETVLYFMSSLKKVRIVTETGSAEFYGRLDLVEREVLKQGVLRIHKSFLVRKAAVQYARPDAVQMTNGEWLPVSRRYRKQVKEAFFYDAVSDAKKGGER